ncbi:MAG: GtrA-like protein, partial [Candidatus Parcubacteria bacterium]
ILAAPVAFLFGFLVSFTMQKYVTFRDGEQRIMRQASKYLMVLVGNLILNTAIVYVLVEYVGLWSVFSQAIASVMIAFESFFVYQLLIFTVPNNET